MDTVTHKQIYERLVSVEAKVDTIDINTKDMVEAFKNLQGAFKVLGWIGSIAKPFLWLAGLLTALTAIHQTLKK
jgi:hypothetical protein